MMFQNLCGVGELFLLIFSKKKIKCSIKKNMEKIIKISKEKKKKKYYKYIKVKKYQKMKIYKKIKIIKKNKKIYRKCLKIPKITYKFKKNTNNT